MRTMVRNDNDESAGADDDVPKTNLAGVLMHEGTGSGAFTFYCGRENVESESADTVLDRCGAQCKSSLFRPI